jgi:hypothetical protein
MSQTKTKPDPVVAEAEIRWRKVQAKLNKAEYEDTATPAIVAAEEEAWQYYESQCRERGMCIRPKCYEPTQWHTHRHCRKHREERGES